MGTTQLKINILGTECEIYACVIKDLTCEFLLDNNFCLKYNLIIDFDSNIISFKTGDSIEMDKIWFEYNGISTPETKKEKENITDKIIVTKDILLPPKVITNTKIKTGVKMNDKQLTINPVDRLSQKLYFRNKYFKEKWNKNSDLQSFKFRYKNTWRYSNRQRYNRVTKL